MRLNLKKMLIVLSITALPLSALAQKVKVGYDKGTDFARFSSYTWAEPAMPITRPLLYANIVATVDHELKAKGLTKMEHNGDLVLIPAGGVEFGLNMAAGTPILPTYGGQPPAIDSTMWHGATGSANLTAQYVPEGALALSFVDRSANKVIWSGTVTEKLDVENKTKSLERVDKAVVKLLKQFPPIKK